MAKCLGIKDVNGVTRSTSFKSTVADVEGLQSALNLKADSSNPTISGKIKAVSGSGSQGFGIYTYDEGASVQLNTADGKVVIDGTQLVIGKEGSTMSVSGTAFDSSPTQNSQKLLTSGSVHTALSGKAASSHTHDSIVGDYPSSEYVKINNGQVKMRGESIELYASDEDLGDVIIKVAGAERNSEPITATINDENIGKLNNVLSGTIAQADVSGLTSSLASKLDVSKFGITTITKTMAESAFDLKDVIDGGRYTITNTTPILEWSNALFTDSSSPSRTIKTSLHAGTVASNARMIFTTYILEGTIYVNLDGVFNH